MKQCTYKLQDRNGQILQHFRTILFLFRIPTGLDMTRCEWTKTISFTWWSLIHIKLLKHDRVDMYKDFKINLSYFSIPHFLTESTSFRWYQFRGDFMLSVEVWSQTSGTSCVFSSKPITLINLFSNLATYTAVAFSCTGLAYRIKGVMCIFPNYSSHILEHCEIF